MKTEVISAVAEFAIETPIRKDHPQNQKHIKGEQHK